MTRPIVLVVAGEASCRELLRDSLASDGQYLVETVASCPAAAARLDHGGVDVLISALDLTDQCAIELLRLARTGARPPAVICLCDDPDDAAIRTLQLGAFDCLPKTCHPLHLRHLVGNCLEHQRLHREHAVLQRQYRLHQHGQHLGALLDMDALLRESLAVLQQEAGTPLRALAFAANCSALVTVVGGAGLTDQQADALAQVLLPQLPVAGGGVGNAAALGVNDMLNDLRRLWVFPLQADNGMHGALVLANAAGADLPAAFPTESLCTVAAQVAMPFCNACRFLGVKELIYTDDLTGLYNYRFLHTSLDREISRAQRYSLQFSLAFLDLDLFKQVNDTHGHLVGSNVLREVGAILRRSVRETDLLFRYGGDEFTVLLVGTDSTAARLVAERIRRGIEDHIFGAGPGKTCRVTATVGFATYPTHASNRQQLIDLADQAMFRGKQIRNVACGVEPDDRS